MRQLVLLASVRPHTIVMGPKVYSRDGCIVCKARRKKCDEVRPECGACVRMKLPCAYSRASGMSKSKAAGSLPSISESDSGKHAPRSVVVTSARRMDWKRTDCPPSEGLSYRAFQFSICESFVVNACELVSKYQTWNFVSLVNDNTN